MDMDICIIKMQTEIYIIDILTYLYYIYNILYVKYKFKTFQNYQLFPNKIRISQVII